MSINYKKKGRTKPSELKNQLARALADYDNLKKRSDQERQEIYKLSLIAIISEFLPVLDSLRSAQEHIKDSGLAIILGEFEQILKDEGFEEIIAETGDKFDNDSFEAVEVEKTDKKENNNKVADLILSRWQLGGSMVRHVKVKVYKYE